MGKIEKRHLLPGNCRYFDKTFLELVLEKSNMSHIFLLIAFFIDCHGNYNAKNGKRKYLKNYLLTNYKLCVADIL